MSTGFRNSIWCRLLGIATWLISALVIVVWQMDLAKMSTNASIKMICVPLNSGTASECKRSEVRVSDLEQMLRSGFVTPGQIFTEIFKILHIRPREYKVYITSRFTAGYLRDNGEYIPGKTRTYCSSTIDSGEKITFEPFKRLAIGRVEFPENDTFKLANWLLHDCATSLELPGVVLPPRSGVKEQSSESYRIEFIPEFKLKELVYLYLLSLLVYFPAVMALLRQIIVIYRLGVIRYLFKN